MAWMAILRYMFTTTNCHWLIILLLIDCRLFITRDVTSGEVREAEYSKQWSAAADRQNISNPRKICWSIFRGRYRPNLHDNANIII